MSDYAAPAHSSRQPLTTQANGYAKPVRSSTWDSQAQAYENEQPHFATDNSRELSKKPSRNMSVNSNDQDGVMEYYKSQANNKRGPTAVKGKPKKKPTRNGSADPNWAAIEHDQNNWIHRDKLKEIEIREMEELGYRVGRGSRSNSRSQSASRRSRDRRGSEATDVNQSGDDRAEPRKVVSPIPAEDEEDQPSDHAWSHPTQEEFAPDDQPTSPRHTVRPSTSRIPLPKTSGIPVPATVADRDAPLPRSRAGSDNWSGDAIAVNGARVRSGSVGSQVLLDGPDGERQITPPYGHTRKNSSSGGGTPPKSPQKSPMKAKAPAKPVGARKTGTQKTQPKNRQTSATSPPKRPGTSSGSVSRPTTSHRPEGEAPWLATMYKPDPRLPPDQQIIPTHAKRMQQEQWENQGRVGSMYDKEFRLLNTDEMKDKRLSQIDPIELENAREKERENEQWPLPSPTRQAAFENEKGDTNTSKSPTNEGGGYKLTPTIPQSPRVPSPNLAPPIAPAGASVPNTTRLPEPVEDAKEKKGCCCIVM